MEIQFDLVVLLHFLAAVLGVMVALVLLYSSRSPHLGFNKWLGFSMLSLAIALMVAFFVISEIALLYPHVYRVGNAFALVYIPLSYIYFRTVITRRKATRWDGLHALPLLFYLVDFMPFFMLPAASKLQILQADMVDFDNSLTYDEGWMTSPNIQLILRTLQFFVYWLLEVRLLRQLYQLNLPGLEKENKSWLLWATVHVSIQSLLFLPSFLVWVFSINGYIFFSTQVFAAISLFVSTVILFFRPDILYGIRGVIVYQKDGMGVSDRIPVVVAPSENHIQHTIYLDVETVRALQDKLEKLMEQKPFLKHGYTSVDLAKDLGIPPYQLSAFLNQNLNKNYNEYINERRILYCLEKLKTNEWDALTIEGIGHECGFSNRNTFTNSFKKFTGETPASYLRGVKDSGLPIN